MKDHGLRIMRGWIGALICTCLAAASHTLADGVAPPLVIVGLVLAISGVICTALAAATFSLLRTALAVLLSQGLYHLVFGLFGHHASGGHVRSIGGTGVHANHTMALSIEPSLGLSPDLGASDGHLMVASHLVAAVLTIATLRKGELAAATLLDSILLCIPRRILYARIWQPSSPRSTPVPASPAGIIRFDFLFPALRRRGPPVILAIA
ncbi:hypothetical protein CQ018_03840 [Arthrobacter sp. MYb227]|uniref:hypothetical protein n=1 Tax=Arthrobacter sp. MYb227 TaxID=1848601 RepID=UPI000CFB8FA6|nr:hypothetical protein [Arthrobacter sp. MYb227]PQZ96395.1 hypothetical protein CQ018_03840 [Arthrobacter sp. MYb227]